MGGLIAPGLILLAPYNAPHEQAGAVIADDHGGVIWEQPLPHRETMNFRVQTYQGRPALTWWQGYITLGHGVGHYVIADSAYATLATVDAGNGLSADLHAFRLTDRGTALLTSYVVTLADLRAVGGSQNGSIQD
ncbi:MAG TPA: arylsulfotransferase family protein, partial [Candidatus Saccharimonadales bacterium]|nr:arylsulfotransferase family protein [Candidatus Saccharimonadales bacterium]